MAIATRDQLRQIYLTDAEKAGMSRLELLQRYKAMKPVGVGSQIGQVAVGALAGFATGGLAGAALAGGSTLASGASGLAEDIPGTVVGGAATGLGAKAIMGSGAGAGGAATGDLIKDVGAQAGRFLEPTQLQEKAQLLAGVLDQKKAVASLDAIGQLQERRKALEATKEATKTNAQIEAEKVKIEIDKTKAEIDKLKAERKKIEADTGKEDKQARSERLKENEKFFFTQVTERLKAGKLGVEQKNYNQIINEVYEELVNNLGYELPFKKKEAVKRSLDSGIMQSVEGQLGMIEQGVNVPAYANQQPEEKSFLTRAVQAITPKQISPTNLTAVGETASGLIKLSNNTYISYEEAKKRGLL